MAMVGVEVGEKAPALPYTAMHAAAI